MGENLSGSAKSLDTVLESTLDSVDVAEELVLQKAAETGFPEEELHKIGMAVREAMVNAVVHGNRYNENKRVHLGVEQADKGLEITITDEGEGFEPTDQPDPLAEENLLRQSGRGLLIMKAFVDEFRIRSAPPLGTEIQLIKYRK